MPRRTISPAAFEDIATELSRFTLSRSITPYRGGATAGASRRPPSHLLRGGVRRAGEVVRVAVQLIEAATDRQLWAERFDATASTLLDVQDEIAARGQCARNPHRPGSPGRPLLTLPASVTTAGCADSSA
jgi:TolB-like protein